MSTYSGISFKKIGVEENSRECGIFFVRRTDNVDGEDDGSLYEKLVAVVDANMFCYDFADLIVDAIINDCSYKTVCNLLYYEEVGIEFLQTLAVLKNLFTFTSHSCFRGGRVPDESTTFDAFFEGESFLISYSSSLFYDAADDYSGKILEGSFNYSLNTSKYLPMQQYYIDELKCILETLKKGNPKRFKAIMSTEAPAWMCELVGLESSVDESVFDAPTAKGGKTVTIHKEAPAPASVNDAVMPKEASVFVTDAAMLKVILPNGKIMMFPEGCSPQYVKSLLDIL
jgi:hypothetical protein